MPTPPAAATPSVPPSSASTSAAEEPASSHASDDDDDRPLSTANDSDSENEQDGNSEPPTLSPANWGENSESLPPRMRMKDTKKPFPEFRVIRQPPAPAPPVATTSSRVPVPPRKRASDEHLKPIPSPPWASHATSYPYTSRQPSPPPHIPHSGSQRDKCDCPDCNRGAAYAWPPKHGNGHPRPRLDYSPSRSPPPGSRPSTFGPSHHRHSPSLSYSRSRSPPPRPSTSNYIQYPEDRRETDRKAEKKTKWIPDRRGAPSPPPPQSQQPMPQYREFQQLQYPQYDSYETRQYHSKVRTRPYAQMQTSFSSQPSPATQVIYDTRRPSEPDYAYQPNASQADVGGTWKNPTPNRYFQPIPPGFPPHVTSQGSQNRHTPSTPPPSTQTLQTLQTLPNERIQVHHRPGPAPSASNPYPSAFSTLATKYHPNGNTRTGQPLSAQEHLLLLAPQIPLGAHDVGGQQFVLKPPKLNKATKNKKASVTAYPHNDTMESMKGVFQVVEQRVVEQHQRLLEQEQRERREREVAVRERERKEWARQDREREEREWARREREKELRRYERQYGEAQPEHRTIEIQEADSRETVEVGSRSAHRAEVRRGKQRERDPPSGDTRHSPMVIDDDDVKKGEEAHKLKRKLSDGAGVGDSATKKTKVHIDTIDDPDGEDEIDDEEDNDEEEVDELDESDAEGGSERGKTRQHRQTRPSASASARLPVASGRRPLAGSSGMHPPTRSQSRASSNRSSQSVSASGGAHRSYNTRPLVPPSLQGSATNTFAAPARPSRKMKKYPCEVCGQVFTRSGDVRRHKDTRHREDVGVRKKEGDGEVKKKKGVKCVFCGRVLTRLDALQRHWDKYCRKKSRRHVDQEGSVSGSASGVGSASASVSGSALAASSSRTESRAGSKVDGTLARGGVRSSARSQGIPAGAGLGEDRNVADSEGEEEMEVDELVATPAPTTAAVSSGDEIVPDPHARRRRRGSVAQTKTGRLGGTGVFRVLGVMPPAQAHGVAEQVLWHGGYRDRHRDRETERMRNGEVPRHQDGRTERYEQRYGAFGPAQFLPERPPSPDGPSRSHSMRSIEQSPPVPAESQGYTTHLHRSHRRDDPVYGEVLKRESI